MFVGLDFQKTQNTLSIFHLNFKIGSCHSAELFSYTAAAHDIKDTLYITYEFLYELCTSSALRTTSCYLRLTERANK